MKKESFEEIKPEKEEILDPEKITKEEYKAGLDETVKKFTATLEKMEDPESEINNLETALGAKGRVSKKFKEMFDEMIVEGEKSAGRS